jgi:hypothetical protein
MCKYIQLSKINNEIKLKTKIPYCRNSSKKYHTVGTVPNSNRKIDIPNTNT